MKLNLYLYDLSTKHRGVATIRQTQAIAWGPKMSRGPQTSHKNVLLKISLIQLLF